MEKQNFEGIASLFPEPKPTSSEKGQRLSNLFKKYNKESSLKNNKRQSEVFENECGQKKRSKKEANPAIEVKSSPIEVGEENTPETFSRKVKGMKANQKSKKKTSCVTEFKSSLVKVGKKHAAERTAKNVKESIKRKCENEIDEAESDQNESDEESDQNENDEVKFDQNGSGIESDQNENSEAELGRNESDVVYDQNKNDEEEFDQNENDEAEFNQNKSNEAESDQNEGDKDCKSGGKKNKRKHQKDEISDSTIFKINTKFSPTEKKPKESLKPFELPCEDYDYSVFVGNLPVTVTKKDLLKEFSKFGPIKSVRFRGAIPLKASMSKKVAVISKNFHPTQNSCIGYVTFRKKLSAVEALSISGKVFQKHHITVNLATAPNSKKTYDEDRTVFVGNLPYNIKDNDIWRTFLSFGEIEGVRVIRDKRTGLGKGFGFVCFKSVESKEKVLSGNEVDIEGRHLRIVAVSQPNKQGTNGFASKRKHRKKRSVFVENLPLDVKDEDVKRVFSSFGEIDTVNVVKDKDTGVGKGTAWLTFQHANSKINALSAKELRIGENILTVVSPENASKPQNASKMKTLKKKNTENSRKTAKKLKKKSMLEKQKKKNAALLLKCMK